MPDYETKHIFSNNLCRLLERNGITQIELAKKMNVAASTVSSWCNGDKMPRMDKVEWMANFFGVSRTSLIDDISNRPVAIPAGFSPMPETVLVPRIGRIACGDPITAEENVEDYDEVLKSWHADFTLICCGDSMLPKIEDGDVVAIRSQPTVENGEIAAVRIGDEATLKRVFLHPDYIELRPLNPEYDSIIHRREEMADIKIEGRAVGLCRNL